MIGASQAVIYLRGSANCPKDEQDLRTGRQNWQCHSAAQELGVNVVETYVDEGPAAAVGARPELVRMLDELEGNDIDYVIVQRHDRLTRDIRRSAAIQATIHEAGARLVTFEITDQQLSDKLLQEPTGGDDHYE